MKPVLYTVPDAAKMLHRNADTLRKDARRGAVPAVKFGDGRCARWYIDVSAIQEEARRRCAGRGI